MADLLWLGMSKNWGEIDLKKFCVIMLHMRGVAFDKRIIFKLNLGKGFHAPFWYQTQLRLSYNFG